VAHSDVNQTIHLFAFSLPDLLDRIVADWDETTASLPQAPSPAPLP
jgi:hypothetical protein